MHIGLEKRKEKSIPKVKQNAEKWKNFMSVGLMCYPLSYIVVNVGQLTVSPQIRENWRQQKCGSTEAYTENLYTKIIIYQESFY